MIYLIEEVSSSVFDSAELRTIVCATSSIVEAAAEASRLEEVYQEYMQSKKYYDMRYVEALSDVLTENEDKVKERASWRRSIDCDNLVRRRLQSTNTPRPHLLPKFDRGCYEVVITEVPVLVPNAE